MYEKKLLDSLIEAAKLVKRVACGSLTMKQFISDYNNFYYYEALDGHEADEEQRKVLKKFGLLVNFHRDIQNNIINKIYLHDVNIELVNLGDRISPEEALDLIKEKCVRDNIEKLLIEINGVVKEI